VRILALLILLAACVHEFTWQLIPDGLGLQGNWRNITQWPLICGALVALHVLARHRFVSAVAAAVAIMSSTTAGCSAWWFFARFELVAGKEQCSRAMSFPLLLVSASVALLVFWCWREDPKHE
jgi:hypothetical protein